MDKKHKRKEILKDNGIYKKIEELGMLILVKDTMLFFLGRIIFVVFILLQIAYALEFIGVLKITTYFIICGVSFFIRLINRDKKYIEMENLSKKMKNRDLNDLSAAPENIMSQSLGIIGCVFFILGYVEMYM